MIKRALALMGAVGITLLAAQGCGSPLEGKANGIQRIVQQSWKNGAYKCQPKHLTLAERNLRFGRDRLKQGYYHDGKGFLELAQDHAQKAFDGSPPERCAQRVVIAPPVRPRKIVVTVLDRDGDGIPDDKDQCPDDPEDFDGFEDEDGCPDPDNDKDGICDNNETIQKNLAKYEAAGVCKGSDKCPDDPEDIDGFEDNDGCPDPDNDGDGICDNNETIQKNAAKYLAAGICKGSDKCPDDPEDIDGFEDDDGCPDPDNDKDGICDANETIQKNLAKYEAAGVCKGADKCPDEPETVNNYHDEDGCPDERPLVTVTKTKIELNEKVFFDYNKATIQTRSHKLLKDVATVLADRPTMRVRIEGHTDSRGPRRYNKRLSMRRAAAVRQFLIGEGIDADRMVSVGYGMERPIANNRTEEGREKNRRVEFFITRQ